MVSLESGHPRHMIDIRECMSLSLSMACLISAGVVSDTWRNCSALTCSASFVASLRSSWSSRTSSSLSLLLGVVGRKALLRVSTVK